MLAWGGGWHPHGLTKVCAWPSPPTTTTKSQLADSRAYSIAPASEATSIGGLSGRVDLWNHQMSFGVDPACSSVTLLQSKRDKLDEVLLLCSRGSAKNTKSSSFPPGRQGAPQLAAPTDPSYLSPALCKQGGDLKLAVLTLTGKNRTREALSVNTPSPGLSPITLGFCPFLAGLCKLFTLLPTCGR